MRLAITLFMMCVMALTLPLGDVAARTPSSKEEISLSFAPVVKQTAPAVVNIFTKRKVVEKVSPFFNDPFFGQFFGRRGGAFGGMTRQRMVSSLGSGVIVDSKGILITNYHVIKGADDITVVLNDKRELDAKVVVTDEQSDLAVLSVDNNKKPLPALSLHDSDSLEVGDLVLAIGNPFGVGQTVTSGIISALARSSIKGKSDFSFFIQTDAAINPGNSGGALVDIKGRLIGIPTAIYSRSGGSNGIGFAIPANMVQALLAGERRNGKIVKPWLGASYQDVTKELAEALELDRPTGVLVNSIYDNSPADRGGLKVGDIIVGIDGHKVDTIQALRFRTAIVEIGERTRMEVVRDGKPKELTVKLTTPPDKPDRDEREMKGIHPFRGTSVANLNPALAMELNLSPMQKGVVVTRSPSRGIRAGDLVISVNGTAIESTRQLEKILRKGAQGWNIQLDRNGQVVSIRVMR
ncbi:MAG: Do family serine endopeptidase [Rickettsiales bacterium]|nr:Do family serine endopeptidase [Rickettsiales bacterium]